MGVKTIEQIEVAGKRVLTRVDFNVPMKAGAITDDRRIREAIPTIRSIIDRGGRAILMSHLGRPSGTGPEEGMSLKPIAKHLGALMGVEVGFPSGDCANEAAAAAVGELADGGVILLENLRFHPGEKKGDPAFAEKLARLGDVYCNDAFGTCHRADASMVAVPGVMAGKPHVAGLLVAREIKYLSDAITNPARPFVAALGGAKVSDKIKAVEHFIRNADQVLIGGAMAYTFLEALGKGVGESRVERELIGEAKRLLDVAAVEKCDLYLPEDHVASSEFAESTGDIEVFEDEIRPGYHGLDIGPETQSRYAAIIARAKTVVWAGPMGVFEWRPFRIGTQEIAASIQEASRAGAVTIVGGGDTAAAAARFDIIGDVSHVSTGGSASLAMLGGEPMPGIDALERA